MRANSRACRDHGRPRLQEEIAAPHAGSRKFLGVRPGLRETPTVPGHRRCRFVVRRFGARADDLDRAPRTRTLGRNATGRSGLRRRSEPGKPEGRGSPDVAVPRVDPGTLVGPSWRRDTPRAGHQPDGLGRSDDRAGRSLPLANRAVLPLAEVPLGLPAPALDQPERRGVAGLCRADRESADHALERPQTDQMELRNAVFQLPRLSQSGRTDGASELAEVCRSNRFLRPHREAAPSESESLQAARISIHRAFDRHQKTFYGHFKSSNGLGNHHNHSRTSLEPNKLGTSSVGFVAMSPAFGRTP